MRPQSQAASHYFEVHPYEGYNYLVELDDDSLYWLIVGHHIEGERRYGPYMTSEYAQRIAIVIHGRGVEAERACPM